MYILKYKNLNSQQAVGMGYVWAPDGQLIPVQTGATNASGMDWGDKTALTSRVKLFGMEEDVYKRQALPRTMKICISTKTNNKANKAW